MHHQHNHCLHALNVCEQCDTVYCTRCNREWRGHLAPHFTWYPSFPYYGTTTISCDTLGGEIGGISGGTLGDIDAANTALTHVHN